MLLYRLTRCIYANDLSGSGARLYGGRWNNEGRAVTYLASTRSLAVLEALVHLRPKDVPDDYCMATVEAPDDFIELDERRLPKGWQDAGDIDALKQAGNIFLYERKSLLMRVPSAIVRLEYNFLLNPAHPDAQKVKVKDAQPFSFDSRLLGTL